MFDKIRNSWALIKASSAVLSADKELIVFPIVSAIGGLVVTATFAFPTILSGLFDALLEGRARIIGFLVAFLFYAVQSFVIVFANSALVGAAMIRLRGGDPTVGDGFRIATKHIGAIAGYAFFSATVGMILRWLSQRKAAGRVIAAIGGLAWNVVTYLVVPVLVIEDIGPVEAIKRSASLLKKTWGEQIVGNFGTGAIFGLLRLLVIILGILALVLVVPTNSVLAIAATALLFVFALVLLGLLESTFSGIYVAAVYRYAVGGETSGFFGEEMVKGAFRTK